MEGPLFVLALLTALGCAVVAGVFFAFSGFVMAALERLPPPEGAAAMQAINVRAVTPAFMTVLFGTAAAGLALLVWVVVDPEGNAPGLVVPASVAYLVGTIGVTAGRNVPLNDRLAALEPRDAATTGLWSDYLVQWRTWNHLRTATSLAAAAALTVALTT
jgi:uncharacterized membrane protein